MKKMLSIPLDDEEIIELCQILIDLLRIKNGGVVYQVTHPKSPADGAKSYICYPKLV